MQIGWEINFSLHWETNNGENIILISVNINKAKIQSHNHRECNGAAPKFSGTNFEKFLLEPLGEMP